MPLTAVAGLHQQSHFLRPVLEAVSALLCLVSLPHHLDDAVCPVQASLFLLRPTKSFSAAFAASCDSHVPERHTSKPLIGVLVHHILPGRTHSSHAHRRRHELRVARLQAPVARHRRSYSRLLRRRHGVLV